MIFALRDEQLVQATPRGRGACPQCNEETIAKCGPIVVWHWAHRTRDCDPWSEPETFWHSFWKQFAARTEVVMNRNGECHRADIVTTAGTVVELQSTFLSLVDIAARERFYGDMVWLYRAAPWLDRLHFGDRGFWWKHGSKAMARSARPLYWDVGEEVWEVRLGLVSRGEGQRVLGRILGSMPASDFAGLIAA